jgi:hypothetical protein
MVMGSLRLYRNRYLTFRLKLFIRYAQVVVAEHRCSIQTREEPKLYGGRLVARAKTPLNATPSTASSI